MKLFEIKKKVGKISKIFRKTAPKKISAHATELNYTTILCFNWGDHLPHRGRAGVNLLTGNQNLQ